MMFVSLIHSINSPIKTPVNRDKIVSLVINAKQIATRGGINVNKPNLTALSPSGKFEIYNDKTKRAITTPAIIKPILNLLSIFIISPKLPKKY